MTRAYNELYLKDAMDNLGEMFDYAQKSCNTKPELIWDLFIASGYADRFASGIPAVISGKSGTELAMEILGEYDAFQDFPEPRKNGRLSKDYWCGSMLAYYQWRTVRSFRDIRKQIAYSDIEDLYPKLHNELPERAAEAIDRLIQRQNKPARLHTLRLASGYTQSGLAEQSGLNIKTLQSYEIRGKNINRAAAESLMMLARTLGCRIEDLMEYGYDVRE